MITATPAAVARLDEIVAGSLPLGDEHARNRIREERRQMLAPNLGVDRSEIRDLRLAEHLETPRRKPPDVAGEHEPGARDVGILDDAIEAARALDVLELERLGHSLDQAADGQLRSHDVRALLTVIKCCSVSSAARSQVNVSANARADAPERCDELARLGEPAHRRGHGAHVAVRNEKARRAVADRLANARRVRRDDGRCAGGGFEIRNAPSLLGRREHESPTTRRKQRELLRLRRRAQETARCSRGQAIRASASSSGR